VLVYAVAFAMFSVSDGFVNRFLISVGNSIYKRWLNIAFKANQMGLVDPDSLTQRLHTVDDEPRRLGRWVEIAREVMDEYGY